MHKLVWSHLAFNGIYITMHFNYATPKHHYDFQFHNFTALCLLKACQSKNNTNCYGNMPFLHVFMSTYAFINTKAFRALLYCLIVQALNGVERKMWGPHSVYGVELRKACKLWFWMLPGVLVHFFYTPPAYISSN